MRNLIGRLNARSQSDLDRIAAAWRAPVTATEKAGTVAQIVRTLTDIRAVRDGWAALDDDARALIAHLSTRSDARSISDLANDLQRDTAEIRDAAIRLYRSGWVARDGDNSELRVDEQPRLFVPPELAHIVRRVRAEITAGDRSPLPLVQLLDELDDVELEAAAQRWGIPVIAGLRSRDELIALIVTATADPASPGRSMAGLDESAVALYDAVRSGPPDGLPLDEALALAGFTIDHPGNQQQIRVVLGQLERALLVWHGYDWKGERHLFVPTEIRTPRTREPIAPPAPIALAESTPLGPYHFHLTWDVLTLLRAMTAPDRPRTRPGDPFPVAFLQRLNRRFWFRGTDLPPSGYVEFITALAIGEGLLVPEANRGPLVVAPDIRRWRDRTFEDQDARLRWRWLTAIDWIEGADQSETHIWGADWRTMRRSLLEALSELPDDGWLPLDLVATWIAQREPALLGRSYTVALGVGVNDDGAEARRAAALSVISLTIRRAFAWFGLIETRRAAAHGYVMRITPRGRAITNGKPLEGAAQTGGLRLHPDATISLLNPSPVQVWSVSAFADLIELNEPARYRLSARSVERAIEAGFQANQISQFLRHQTGRPLPDPVNALLEKEQRDHPIVHLESATLLTPASDSARAELKRLLHASGIPAEDHGNDLLVRAHVTTSERLATILRSGGLVIRSTGD